MYKVFVYGTLKRGHRLHALLKDATFVKKYVTEKPFIMTSIADSYPMICENHEHGKPVKGEVYEVSKETLLVLDEVELNAGYHRHKYEDDIYIYVTYSPHMGMKESEYIKDDGNTYEWVTEW